jgi:carbon storage regulator
MGVLVLNRKLGERILLDGGSTAVIEVLSISGNKCRIGVTAPKEVQVMREEVLRERKEEGK